MAQAAKARRKTAAGGGRSAQAPYHHGALRAALLEVAESVLLDHGLEGFTLRECARRAGVSHGAPAHHFGDARGLLTEFTAVSFEQLAALMQEYRDRAAPDGYSQFVATGLAYVDYALAHRARFQLMFRSDRLDHGNQRLQAAARPRLRALARNHGASDDSGEAAQRLARAEDRARLVDGARVRDADAGQPEVCRRGRRRRPARARPDRGLADAQPAGVRSRRPARGTRAACISR